MTLHQLDTLINTYGDVTLLQAQSLKGKYFTRLKDLINIHGDITVRQAELIESIDPELEEYDNLLSEIAEGLKPELTV